MGFNPDDAFDNQEATAGTSWLKAEGRHLLKIGQMEHWTDEHNHPKMSAMFSIERTDNPCLQVGEEFKQSWNFAEFRFKKYIGAERAKVFLASVHGEVTKETLAAIKMVDVRAVCGEKQPLAGKLVWCEATKNDKGYVNLKFIPYRTA